MVIVRDIPTIVVGDIDIGTTGVVSRDMVATGIVIWEL